MRTFALAALAAVVLAPAAEAANILPGNGLAISTNGIHGVLRAGSPWGPGSTPSDLAAPIDGTAQPEGTQWNNGSFWWDQDPSINPATLYWTLQLNKLFNIMSLQVQADDNDSYRVEYWNGSAWATAIDVPTQPSFGLVTRPAVPVSFTTDRLRISATGGDNYYAIGQLIAEGTAAVPEPDSWALLIAGFGLTGAVMRRRRRALAA